MKTDDNNKKQWKAPLVWRNRGSFNLLLTSHLVIILPDFSYNFDNVWESLKCERLLLPNTRDSLVLLIYLSLIKEYQLKITSNMINKSKSVMVSNFVELILKIGNVSEKNYGFIVSIKLRRDQVIKKACSNQMQVYLLKYTHQLFLICQA